MASNVEILGIEKLKFALENVEKKLRTKAIKDALKLGAIPVSKQMKKNVPILNFKKSKSKTKTRTRGLIRRSIKIRTSSVDRRKKDIGVFVNVKPAPKDQRGAKSKTDPFYWKFINYGWSPGNRKKTTKRKKARTVKAPLYSIRGIKFIESGATKLPESLKIIEAEFVKFIKGQDNAG